MYGSVSDSNHNSNLLHFYVSVLRHSGVNLIRSEVKGEGLKAHVLSDSGASHKFVRPQFLRKMERLTGHILPVMQDGKIKVTTANAVIEAALRKVELVLDMDGCIYKGWFIVFDLVKYDIILGKEWLAEVEHEIDHQQNILKLGRQKENVEEWSVHIKGLWNEILEPSGANEVGRGWSTMGRERDESETESDRKDGVQSKPMIGKATEHMVVEVVMAEIEAYWEPIEMKAGRVGEQARGNKCGFGFSGSEEEESLMSVLCSLEGKIKSEFEDLFHEPKGLPPHRERFGDFRIRLLPGSEAPYRSPYRLTPAEWTE